MKTEHAPTKKFLDNISKQIAALNSGAATPSYSLSSYDPSVSAGLPFDINSSATGQQDNSGEPGFLNRIIDVLSRPGYAVKNVIKDTIDKDPNTDNPLESFWAGLSGVDKTMTADIFDKAQEYADPSKPAWQQPFNFDYNPVGKGIAGFIGDVALDPLTYTTFGVGPAITKGISAGSKALQGAKTYEKAVKAGETLTQIAPEGIRAAKPQPINDITPKAATKVDEPIPTSTEEPSLFDLTPEQKAAQANAERRTTIGDAVEANGPINVTGTPRATTEPKWRDATQQSRDVWNAVAAAARHDEIASLSGKQRFSAISDDVFNVLQGKKMEGIGKGIYPVVRTDRGAYHLDVTDVIGLDKKLSDYYIAMPSRGGVPPSTLLAGAGAVLDARHMGLGARETIDYVANAVKKGHTTKQTVSMARATRVANDLIRHSDDLEARVIENEIAFGLRDATQGTKIGEQVADDTLRTLEQPMLPFAESIKSLSDVTGKVSRAADAEGISISGAMLGAKTAAEKIATKVPENDLAASRSINSVSRDLEAGAPATKVKAKQKVQRKKDDAEAIAQAGPIYSLANRTDTTVQHGIQRGYAGLLSRTVHGFRQGELAANYRNWGGAGEALAHVYHQVLQKVATKWDVNSQQAAVFAIMHNTSPTNPAIAEAVADIRPLMEHLLPMGTGREAVMEMAMARNGIDIDTMNMLYAEHGLPKFEFKPVKGETLSQTLQQWRKWDFGPRPLDALAKLQAATQEGMARLKVGHSFTDEFGVDSARAGYGRIKQTDAKMSRFIDPDKYYPLEAIDQMRLFNNVFDKSTSFRGQTGIIATLANNVIDPYLAVWKPSATIIRPGHHVRNMIGDFLLNALYGVRSPRWYMKAANIQRAGGQFTGDLEALTRLAGPRGLPDNTGHAFTVTLKDGRQVEVTNAQAFQHANQDGLLPSYRISEDVLQDRAAGGQMTFPDRVAKRVQDNKIIQAAGKFSESYSHHFRLAQYSKMMADPKFTKRFSSVEQASNEAVKIAQKWHPDVRGLAPAEAKVMRRLMPFYTWFRQAMPIVFNSMLLRPGQTMEIPKAFYNTQIAMGLEPKSMEQPFDPSKLYPSFIQSHLTGNLSAPGILGLNDFSANIGSPIEGAADVFNGNIPTNLIGMLNPLLKAPIELSSQTKLGNGQYIPDKGEYIDQMIPFVNQITNLSGYSASGSVANLLSGNGDVPDPQRAMQKGEKDFLLNRSLLNWLTGLGIQDLDRPSYQKIATKEIYG